VAAAGAAAGGGGGQRGCTERDGLTMTWKSPESGPGFTIIQRVFLPYTGQDESGNATFGLVADRYITDRDSTELTLRVSKSGDQWLLEAAFSSPEGAELIVIAQSADLYEGWVGLPPRPFDDPFEDIKATCGDQTYRRLCITTQNDSTFGTFTSITGGVEAIIPEFSEEYPSGYGGFDRGQLVWRPDDDRWAIGVTIIEEADDISQPPIGQFDTGRGQVTIVEGNCTGEIPTPPEPTLVTTSDIQLNIALMCLWNWSSFSGTGQSAGSIGSFLIDGQSGSVFSIPSPLEFFTFQVNGPIAPGNTYQVTLLPSANGQVQLGIGKTSYNLVSMVLNITVAEGTSPITQEAGVITAISGTITYEDDGSSAVAPGGPGSDPIKKP
jgi:hypothetical protein